MTFRPPLLEQLLLLLGLQARDQFAPILPYQRITDRSSQWTERQASAQCFAAIYGVRARFFCRYPQWRIDRALQQELLVDPERAQIVSPRHGLALFQQPSHRERVVGSRRVVRSHLALFDHADDPRGKVTRIDKLKALPRLPR